MQPNDQQGYYQPGQGQPVQPGPQPPTPGVSPVAPPTVGVAPVIDPAAMQQALAEPYPQQPVAQPVMQQPLNEEPAPEEVYDDEGDYTDEPVTWVAQEYIHREKGTAWFFFFTIIIIALIAVSVLTKAWSFTALIVVIALVVVVYSRRPPRELTYSITDEGLTVDGALHKFSRFKSFGIIHDGDEFSVMLIPTQRFQPGISVYFPEEAGEDIVDMLGSRLPMKDLKLDAVDRIVRLLRL